MFSLLISTDFPGYRVFKFLEKVGIQDNNDGSSENVICNLKHFNPLIKNIINHSIVKKIVKKLNLNVTFFIWKCSVSKSRTSKKPNCG